MEIWKEITNYEGTYEVSNYGSVKSLSRKVGHFSGILRVLKEKLLKPDVDKAGYLLIGLRKDNIQKKFLNHRLVAAAFIPNPSNKLEVNHINGIKSDNRVENLEWVTSSENKIHAFKEGLNPGCKGVKKNKKLC